MFTNGNAPALSAPLGPHDTVNVHSLTFFNIVPRGRTGHSEGAPYGVPESPMGAAFRALFRCVPILCSSRDGRSFRMFDDAHEPAKEVDLKKTYDAVVVGSGA